MQINKSLRTVILLETAIPIVLLVLGIYHGLLQVLYRAGVIKSMSFFGLEYYQGLTLHGVVNAIVLTTFFAVAFGNAVVIYYLKKEINKSMAWLSFGLMLIGTLMAALAILSGKATVLYTFYPPLMAHPAFYIGAVLLVIGSWIAFFNWIPTYLNWKRENKDAKTPLAVLGIFTTFIVWFMATIPVAIEILFMLLPWSLGWVPEVNVMLARTLFWFFGHPLVYFWLLPSYIMFYVMLPKEAGGKLFSDRAGRLVFMLFIILSIPVGVHHQFADPAIGQGLKFMSMILTFGVAIPSFITAFTIAASLEYAGKMNGAKGLLGWIGKLPYLDKERYLFAYLISGLIIFIFGGLTGMVNASYNLNMVIHNTSWVPGHFHLTVGGPVFLAILGGSIHLLSKLTGKEIQLKNWNVWVPYLWLIGLLIFSTGMMIGGLHGEPRRTNLGLTYTNPDSPFYRADWISYVHIAMVGGIIMTISALMYFAVFFKTLFSKKMFEPIIEFPTSEAYHDEQKTKLLENFWPWIVLAIIIIAIAYTPAIMDVLNNTGPGSPPFDPNSPSPINR